MKQKKIRLKISSYQLWVKFTLNKKIVNSHNKLKNNFKSCIRVTKIQKVFIGFILLYLNYRIMKKIIIFISIHNYVF